MLLRFRVANYRSIRDEQELSFVATELNEGTAREVSLKHSGSVRVLPAIGIYGSNASGKSNVLSALLSLAILCQGFLHTGPEGKLGLGWDPHLLDAATHDQPTHFEVEFLADGIRFVYGLRFTDGAVVSEWLHAYPRGRRQIWFERDASSPEPLRFPDNHLGPAQSTLAELVRPDRPFISLANEVRQPQLAPVARWFRSVSDLSDSSDPALFDRSVVGLFTGRQGDQMLDMLQRADPGIEGIEIVKDESGVGGRRLRLRHRGRSGAASLPLRFESRGTQAWLSMLRPLLPVLAGGGLLIVDELDASLHPELAAEAIRMFYDTKLNQHGAQLLFSSHDASLLSTAYGRPLLDRDQVWFTEKDQEGATELYPLADLKPRKGENIERGYLSGRYGAVPGLSPGELARALWPEEDGSK